MYVSVEGLQYLIGCRGCTPYIPLRPPGAAGRIGYAPGLIFVPSGAGRIPNEKLEIWMRRVAMVDAAGRNTTQDPGGAGACPPIVNRVPRVCYT